MPQRTPFPHIKPCSYFGSSPWSLCGNITTIYFLNGDFNPESHIFFVMFAAPSTPSPLICPRQHPKWNLTLGHISHPTPRWTLQLFESRVACALLKERCFIKPLLPDDSLNQSKPTGECYNEVSAFSLLGKVSSQWHFHALIQISASWPPNHSSTRRKSSVRSLA